MGKAVYTCLLCKHTESIECTKETYQEVRVCPLCRGAFVDSFRKKLYEPISKTKPLLTIELQDESSTPRVIYKGEEIKHKLSVQFDWESDTSVTMGGLTYVIEHTEMDKGQPTNNRIERRVKGHAY